jgi:hypothetical protein
VREIKLHYEFNNETYRAEYDMEENALYVTETKLVDGNFITNETKNCGALFGKTKFDQHTIDDYIHDAMGAYIPIFHPVRGIIRQLSQLSGLPHHEIDLYTTKYPKLLGGNEPKSPDESNKYLKQLTKCVFSVVDQTTHEIIEQREVIDRAEENWWSVHDVPFVDIREFLPLDICDVIVTQSTSTCSVK